MMLFRAIIISGCLFALTGCGSDEQSTATEKSASANTAASGRFYYTVIQVDGGWGYDLYIDSTMYIHQVHIPAVNGLVPFTSESDAAQVAEIAVKKMEEGVVPPTITMDELNAVGIVMPAQN